MQVNASSTALAHIDGRVDLSGFLSQTFTIAEATDFSVDRQITGDKGLTKAGPGSLWLHGINEYTGATLVAEGELVLANFFASNATLKGPLTVGDGVGSGGSAVVRLLGEHQIADNVPVTVNSDGRFDGDGNGEYLGPLTVNGGSVTMEVPTWD